ncbi:MAG: amino acid transporter [Devosia sp.]
MRQEIGKVAGNEQIKLSAAYVNGVAVGLVTAGVLAPLISVFAGSGSSRPWQLVAVLVSCILVSAALHFGARTLLRGMAE